MAERVPNEIKIVAWFMAAKNVIKFANDDTTYKLADAVIKASNFEKFPLSKGDKVEVGLKEGVVTFLRKQKSETKAMNGSEEAYEPTPDEAVDTRLDKPESQAPKVIEPEVKKETSAPKADGETSTVLTVFAVAANKKVVKFLEVKDSGWFQIDEAIQAQDYATIGLVAKNKVKVVFNDKTVISLAKVASEPAEQPKTATSSPANAKAEQTVNLATTAQLQKQIAPLSDPKKEWKPYNSNESDARQKSIEAQAAVNAASNVAARIGASLPQAPTASVVNNMIRAIAESNFALIQELKSK